MQSATGILQPDQPTDTHLLHKLTTLILTAVTLYIAFGSQKTAYSADNKSVPNIVFILADDMGYGDIKALNPECKIATPHLDQLAKGGMVFTDAHTSSSVCTPTRYGVLTGRYNWRSRLKSGVLWDSPGG